MSFWLAAACLALLASLWLARPLLIGRAAAAPRAAHDLQVFRDQLRALDRDVDRGVLSAPEADGARAEISRRLLAAAAELDRVGAEGPAPERVSRRLAAGVAVVVILGTVGAYWGLGAPGMPDRPLAQRGGEIRQALNARPLQADAEVFAADRVAAMRPPAPEAGTPEAEARALVERLREIVATRPEDVRGRRLLADSLIRLGEPVEARRLHEEILSLLGETAGTDDFAAAGEALVMAAAGYVSPEAEALMARALQADPTNPIARYYAGLALLQNGETQLALELWTGLLEEGPEDAPWIPSIRAQIAEIAREAGAGPLLIPGPGPSQDQIDAAGEMTEDQQREMIEGMVSGLEGRLALEGGTPEDWARLIRAYGVLGRPDDAARIWSDAERAFAELPEVVAALRAVAVEAGVNAARDGG